MAKNYLFNSDGATFVRNIHTPSAQAKNSFVYLQESGLLSAFKAHKGKVRRKLDSYLFFTVTDGSGKITYDGKDYNLRKNDCVFIDCKNHGYSHQSSAENHWKLKWVHFYGSPADEYHKIFTQFSATPVFSVKNASDFNSLCDRLLSQNEENTVLQDVVNSMLLTQLCFLCINAVRTKSTDSQMLQIREYIDTNCHENLTLENIAQHFYISRFTLSHKFKAEIGSTVLEYITKKRISKAKELLRYTDKTIESISEECGIGDANYFAKVFKKSEGITAREYRNQW